MTHFDLFELPITLKVDSSGLSKQYFALQRKYHPDRFVSNGIKKNEYKCAKPSAGRMIQKQIRFFTAICLPVHFEFVIVNQMNC